MNKMYFSIIIIAEFGDHKFMENLKPTTPNMNKKIL